MLIYLPFHVETFLLLSYLQYVGSQHAVQQRKGGLLRINYTTFFPLVYINKDRIGLSIARTPNKHAFFFCKVETLQIIHINYTTFLVYVPTNNK
jgi:hypothetical protein